MHLSLAPLLRQLVSRTCELRRKPNRQSFVPTLAYSGRRVLRRNDGASKPVDRVARIRKPDQNGRETERYERGESQTLCRWARNLHRTFRFFAATRAP